MDQTDIGNKTTNEVGETRNINQIVKNNSTYKNRSMYNESENEITIIRTMNTPDTYTRSEAIQKKRDETVKEKVLETLSYTLENDNTIRQIVGFLDHLVRDIGDLRQDFKMHVSSTNKKLQKITDDLSSFYNKRKNTTDNICKLTDLANDKEDLREELTVMSDRLYKNRLNDCSINLKHN